MPNQSPPHWFSPFKTLSLLAIPGSFNVKGSLALLTHWHVDEFLHQWHFRAQATSHLCTHAFHISHTVDIRAEQEARPHNSEQETKEEFLQNYTFIIKR